MFSNYRFIQNAGLDSFFGILQYWCERDTYMWKCLRHCWYNPKKVYLRHQAINIALLKRSRAWLDGPLRFEDHVSLGCVTPLIDLPYPHSTCFDRVTGARDETPRPNSRRLATTGWSMSNQQVELITKIICSRQCRVACLSGIVLSLELGIKCWRGFLL